MVLSILRSKKVTKRILWGILIFIIPAFVLFGVGSVTKKPALIGQIGNQKVYADDFAESREAIKVQMLFTYYQDYTAMTNILKNRPMINYISWERLIFLEAARRKKLKATNKDVMVFISQHPLFQKNGIFNKEVYDYILKNNLSMEPRQFEEIVRENMQIRSLRQSLLKDVNVSDEDILASYKKVNDKVELSYLFIDKDIFAGNASVSPDEVQDYYEDNKSLFLEPEKIEVEYIEFSFEDPSQKASAISKLEKIYPRLIKFPSQFKDIATGQELIYGKTDPFSREDVIPGIPFFKEFQDTAFRLEEDEISIPIFSDQEKGKVFVLRKIRDVPQKLQDFEEIKEKLAGTLMDLKSLELAKNHASEVYEKLSDGRTSLKNEAQAINREVKTSGPVAYDGYIENIGPAGQIVLNAMEVDQGDIITPVTTKNGIFIARLDNIIPADKSEMEAEKEKLRQNLLLPKQIATMNKWFEANQSRVKLFTQLDEL